MSLKKEEFCFDEFLWSYIKSFILYRGCCLYNNSCTNPGTEIYLRLEDMGEFVYLCRGCYAKIFDRTHKEDEVYNLIRQEVSTRVVGIASLKSKIKALSDKNLLRVLSIPPTYRNNRPLKKMRSHVLLYKIPAEK
jgi:hypothetical protein